MRNGIPAGHVFKEGDKLSCVFDHGKDGEPFLYTGTVVNVLIPSDRLVFQDGERVSRSIIKAEWSLTPEDAVRAFVSRHEEAIRVARAMIPGVVPDPTEVIKRENRRLQTIVDAVDAWCDGQENGGEVRALLDGSREGWMPRPNGHWFRTTYGSILEIRPEGERFAWKATRRDDTDLEGIENTLDEAMAVARKAAE